MLIINYWSIYYDFKLLFKEHKLAPMFPMSDPLLKSNAVEGAEGGLWRGITAWM